MAIHGFNFKETAIQDGQQGSTPHQKELEVALIQECAGITLGLVSSLLLQYWAIQIFIFT
jgi:hypothetical protein